MRLGGEDDAATEGDPRRHRRVHGRGHADRVDGGGEDDARAPIDHRAFGHGTPVDDEVEQTALRIPPHAVDPGHEGEGEGLGVVRPVRLGSDARMQRGGEHLDDGLLRAGGLRIGRVEVLGDLIEIGDDGGVHGSSWYSWYHEL
ncbi:hypothetical protein GCM10010988_03630 [Cnuibacter physcomitrellae]|uniref:hypothetical protein n=1 Tax=Cnuibacter physcomitrellae TaxID=1619308 RepID=UPI0019B04A70|nr:hypothetical protein [Cnuibacter physcomitrellae]GGI35379.1 hypothetical protein GCM10010988_03630 [Cnuibacter physcomitrellae]